MTYLPFETALRSDLPRSIIAQESFWGRRFDRLDRLRAVRSLVDAARVQLLLEIGRGLGREDPRRPHRILALGPVEEPERVERALRRLRARASQEREVVREARRRRPEPAVEQVRAQ